MAKIPNSIHVMEYPIPSQFRNEFTKINLTVFDFKSRCKAASSFFVYSFVEVKTLLHLIFHSNRANINSMVLYIITSRIYLDIALGSMHYKVRHRNHLI
jgi:hypothetical protein